MTGVWGFVIGVAVVVLGKVTGVADATGAVPVLTGVVATFFSVVFAVLVRAVTSATACSLVSLVRWIIVG